MAVGLADHLQTVGYLKCIARQYIEGQKGVRSNPLEPPLQLPTDMLSAWRSPKGKMLQLQLFLRGRQGQIISVPRVLCTGSPQMRALREVTWLSVYCGCNMNMSTIISLRYTKVNLLWLLSLQYPTNYTAKSTWSKRPQVHTVKIFWLL